MEAEVVNTDYSFSVSPDSLSTYLTASKPANHNISSHCKEKGKNIVVKEIEFVLIPTAPNYTLSIASVKVFASAQKMKCDGEFPMRKGDKNTVNLTVTDTSTTPSSIPYTGTITIEITDSGQDKVKAN